MAPPRSTMHTSFSSRAEIQEPRIVLFPLTAGRPTSEGKLETVQASSPSMIPGRITMNRYSTDQQRHLQQQPHSNNMRAMTSLENRQGSLATSLPYLGSFEQEPYSSKDIEEMKRRLQAIKQRRAGQRLQSSSFDHSTAARLPPPIRPPVKEAVHEKPIRTSIRKIPSKPVEEIVLHLDDTEPHRPSLDRTKEEPVPKHHHEHHHHQHQQHQHQQHVGNSGISREDAQMSGDKDKTKSISSRTADETILTHETSFSTTITATTTSSWDPVRLLCTSSKPPKQKQPVQVRSSTKKPKQIRPPSPKSTLPHLDDPLLLDKVLCTKEPYYSSLRDHDRDEPAANSNVWDPYESPYLDQTSVLLETNRTIEVPRTSAFSEIASSDEESSTLIKKSCLLPLRRTTTKPWYVRPAFSEATDAVPDPKSQVMHVVYFTKE